MVVGPARHPAPATACAAPTCSGPAPPPSRDAAAGPTGPPRHGPDGPTAPGPLDPLWTRGHDLRRELRQPQPGTLTGQQLVVLPLVRPEGRHPVQPEPPRPGQDLVEANGHATVRDAWVRTEQAIDRGRDGGRRAVPGQLAQQQRHRLRQLVGRRFVLCGHGREQPGARELVPGREISPPFGTSVRSMACVFTANRCRPRRTVSPPSPYRSARSRSERAASCFAAFSRPSSSSAHTESSSARRSSPTARTFATIGSDAK
jgi:hypothetical protein